MKVFLKKLVLTALLMVVPACGGSGSGSGQSVDTAGDPVAGPSVNQSPAMSVSEQDLLEALTCSTDLRNAGRSPILMVPGTSLDPEANFAWNWLPALEKLGWPYCTIELPQNAMGDIQTSAEYIVFAVRRMFAESGRRVQILGYSQGGMVPRWALRYWPDIRAMVDDLVGFSAPNHGTIIAAGACISGCAPAIWQQNSGSNFIATLNRDFETVSEVSYTSVYTRIDEVVIGGSTAPAASSVLRDKGPNIVNIATQEICPLSLADHLTIGTSDPVAYAVAIDALTHAGPADPARIHSDVCMKFLMPGVGPATFATDLAAMNLFIATTLITAERVPEEPGLRCYVDNKCQ